MCGLPCVTWGNNSWNFGVYDSTIQWLEEVLCIRKRWYLGDGTWKYNCAVSDGCQEKMDKEGVITQKR